MFALLTVLGLGSAVVLVAVELRRQAQGSRQRDDTLETRQRLNFEWCMGQMDARMPKQPIVNLRKTVPVDYAAGVEPDGHWNEDLSKTSDSIPPPAPSESGFRPRVMPRKSR